MGSAPLSNVGCLRHVLIGLGVFCLFAMGLVMWHRTTFGIILSNMTAISEGSRDARTIGSPDDLLTYVAAHPEWFSLVSYDVGREDEGIFFGADSERPTAGMTRFLVLAALAELVAEGAIDLEERVALGAISRLFVPGTAVTAHKSSLEKLRSVADTDDTVSLTAVVDAMMRHGDPAAHDLLVLRIGAERLRSVTEALGLAGTEPPFPQAGVFLNWRRTGSIRADVLPAPGTRDDRAIRSTAATELAERFVNDEEYRAGVLDLLLTRGAELSLRQQREFAASTFPRATARDLSLVMAGIVAEDDAVAGSSGSLRNLVEIRLAHDENREGPSLQAIGSRAGSFPGILSVASFARRSDLPAGRVVVLLAHNLPMGVYYHLMQTGLDRGLQLQLMVDDLFFERTRELLTSASDATPANSPSN
jgi:hypothetical protein